MTEVAVALVGLWALVGLVLAARQRPLVGAQVLLGSAFGAAALWGINAESPLGTLAAWFVPATVAWAALGLPDGRLGGPSRALLAVAIAVTAAGVGVAYVVADRAPSSYEIGGASTAVVALVAPSVRRRGRETASAERPRLQLAASGIAFASAAALLAGALAVATDSDFAYAVFWLATGVPGLALVAGTFAGARRAAGRCVSIAMATAAFAVVIVGGQAVALLVAGRVPEADERDLVGPSFLGAAFAALAFGPTRKVGASLTNRWVLGSRRTPEHAARRMTERARAGVPLDEVFLQLAETLRDSFAAQRVEVWNRPGLAFERVVSAPAQPTAVIECTADEIASLAHASVVGDTWLGTWVPRLREGREDRQVRVAPAVHSGAVLGFVLVERFADDARFTDSDDLVLAEVGSRFGEVLHARRLDAALTATLDDLRASRSRLVAAADAERRRIERNLHDGAQQHLVAMAVNLRLAQDLVSEDPEASIDILRQLGDDVRDTIDQLRDLAHGIYPPLLADLGLAEALSAAARRSPQPVTVDVATDRYPPEIEAAVYFCCLEALQNAAKHAPGANVQIRLWQANGSLRFEVVDDGPGFDPNQARSGHGHQNMVDRLGAIGGSVEWSSAPGIGTRVAGEVQR